MLTLLTLLSVSQDCTAMPRNVTVPPAYSQEGYPVDGSPGRLAHFRGYLQEVALVCDGDIETGEGFRWVSVPGTIEYQPGCQRQSSSARPKSEFVGVMAVTASVTATSAGNVTGDPCQPWDVSWLYVGWDAVFQVTVNQFGDYCSEAVSIPLMPELIGTRLYAQTVLQSIYYYTSELYELTIQ